MVTNCKNCGAPLNGGKCEYCETEYRNSENITLHNDIKFVEHDAEFMGKLVRSMVLTPNEARRYYGLRDF